MQTTMNPTKTNTLHYGTDQKNSLFCCVCFSSRLFYHFLSFVYFLLRKGRERFLKLALFLLSVLVKGEPFWILSVLVRGRNFNKGRSILSAARDVCFTDPADFQMKTKNFTRACFIEP